MSGVLVSYVFPALLVEGHIHIFGLSVAFRLPVPLVSYQNEYARSLPARFSVSCCIVPAAGCRFLAQVLLGQERCYHEHQAQAA